MRLLQQHIEALIFTAENGISVDEIQSCLKGVYGWEVDRNEIREHIGALQARYGDEEYAFEIVEIADGFQFLSKKAFHSAVHGYLQIKEKKKLSTAALETLAIIAYKQPVSKSEIEKIRGVNCDYSIQKLLEKDLIAIEGKSDGPGRPLIYGTSRHFMDHFGLKNVKDLPKLRDLRLPDNAIGSPADQEEMADAAPLPDHAGDTPAMPEEPPATAEAADDQHDSAPVADDLPEPPAPEENAG